MSNPYATKWCSLPWSGSRGRHAETNALRDDLKDNCKQDYDFAASWKLKRIHNPLICSAFCDINKSLIKSVWNYTKRYPRPFFLKLWTSFTPQVMKMLILLANSHSLFIIDSTKWFLACQSNTQNSCFLILTTLPASKLVGRDSNDPIDHGAER